MTDADLSNIEAAAKMNAASLPLFCSETLALVAEVRNLRRIVEGLAARVVAQSELLSKRAEKADVQSPIAGRRCEECSGRGNVQSHWHHGDPTLYACPDCHGTGRIAADLGLVVHVVANDPEAARELTELCAKWHRQKSNSLYVDWSQSLDSWREVTP